MSEFEDTQVWNDFFNNDEHKVSRLKNYEFLEKIGQGGMGAVYKARQLHPHRFVAIKISKAVSTSSVRRFEREMQIASQLEHPGIAKIYDAGVQNNQKYLVMDYIEGQSLDKYFATASTNEKLNIIIEVCSILDYAHRQNIIHRDLKPANIMITNNGKPVVIDFGLAKNIQTRNFDLTKTGEVLGTPNYMAPEQIAGKSSNIDHRVDIYALGAIIYEIICGEKMVTSTNSLEALFQIQQASFISPLKINPSANKNLVNIWRKATALKKEHRYKDVVDLKNDLSKVILGHRVKDFRNKRVSMIIIITIFFMGLLSYTVYQRKSASIELSKNQKEQQQKNETKLKQMIPHIENKKLPKNLDSESIGFNDPQRMEIVKALYNVGFYQKALKILEAVSLPNTIAMYYKGLIFYKEKQYAQAQKVFEMLSKNKNDNHKYCYYLGLSAFKQQDIEKALQNLEKAEPNFLQDIPLLEALAEIWERKNNHQKAKSYLQRCVAIVPSAGKYSIKLGKIELRNKNYHQAFSHLKKALDTDDFFKALELLHEIPYNEPRLRRRCYQSIMYKCISEKTVKQPDLFREKWQEIEDHYRQDYIAQHQAKKRRTHSIRPFLKTVSNDKIKETLRKALIALRYSDSFSSEMDKLLKDGNLSQASLEFFKETAAIIHTIKNKEKRAIYHKLAYMHRNNSWNSQEFDIDRKNCLDMLRTEEKVFLRYLLIEGYLHMFGVEPIITIAKNPAQNIITRMLCCVVLRKNYLAEDITIFYSLPQHEQQISVEEREFLQVNISQAMYVPHFIHRTDIFHRPARKENKIVAEEEQLLWHLINQKNSQIASVTAALSLHALLPKNAQNKKIDTIIFDAMKSTNMALSSYTHSLFWISPNSDKYFNKYKESLQSKHLVIQEIVLSQIEVFRHRILELMPEIQKCILQKPSEMLLFRAIFAWTLAKRNGTSIFEDPLYKSIAGNLKPLEQSSILIFEFQKFFFDTRKLGKHNQIEIIKQARTFLEQLRQQLKNLPPTSQCMISYVMSLLQLHPSLQELRDIQDTRLLSYFLYQLHQQVYLGGGKETFLPFIGAISPNQKYYIAKQFLSHKNSKVAEHATISYITFASEKERDKMYEQVSTSQNKVLQKSVALGYYFALQNDWINEKKQHSIGFEDLFSGKPVELILFESFERLRKFSQEVALRSPQKFQIYQKWVQRCLALCPQQSEYIYLHQLFFSKKDAIAKMRNAIKMNSKETGDLKYVYTLRLLDLLMKDNQQIDSDLPTISDIPTPLLVYFAEIYKNQEKYAKALEHHIKFFLARTRDYSPFGSILSLNSEIIYYLIKNNHHEAAKAFLEYFYQLYRRAGKPQLDRHSFLQELKKSKPHIDIAW